MLFVQYSPSFVKVLRFNLLYNIDVHLMVCYRYANEGPCFNGKCDDHIYLFNKQI